jgi:hypothetical protein
MLIPGPLYHNGPFLWAMVALFKGCTVGVTSRFDAEETLAQIERLRADVIYTVPISLVYSGRAPDLRDRAALLRTLGSR